MEAGSLHYASRRKAGAGGHVGIAACRCRSGAGVLGKLPKQLLFPVCVHLVHPISRPCPRHARACIVLPRAAPQWGGRANPENRILRKTQEVRQTI